MLLGFDLGESCFRCVALVKSRAVDLALVVCFEIGTHIEQRAVKIGHLNDLNKIDCLILRGFGVLGY